MGFNKFGGGNRGFGGGSGFGGGNRFGGRSSGPRPMHQATCSKCGQDCEVPFRPTGDRPVFCSNCFKTEGGGAPRFAPKSFGGGNVPTRPAGSVTKEQFDMLNSKIDKILSLLGASKLTKLEEKSTLAAPIVKTGKAEDKKAKTLAKKAKAKKK